MRRFARILVSVLILATVGCAPPQRESKDVYVAEGATGYSLIRAEIVTLAASAPVHGWKIWVMVRQGPGTRFEARNRSGESVYVHSH